MIPHNLLYLWLTVIVTALLVCFIQLWREPLDKVFVPLNQILWGPLFTQHHPTLNHLTDILTRYYHIQSVFLHNFEQHAAGWLAGHTDLSPDVLYRTVFPLEVGQLTLHLSELGGKLRTTKVLPVQPGDMVTVPVLHNVHCSHPVLEYQWTLHPYRRRHHIATRETGVILQSWSRQKRVKQLEVKLARARSPTKQQVDSRNK